MWLSLDKNVIFYGISDAHKLKLIRSHLQFCTHVYILHDTWNGLTGNAKDSFYLNFLI